MNIAVICFNFQEKNKRYQPWRYIYEIFKGIQSSGKHNVTIITDGSTNLPNEEILDGILIQRLNEIKTLSLKKNNNLLTLIGKGDFDLIFWSIGPLSFQHLQTFKQIKVPIIGLFTGPMFSLREIGSLGFSEIIRNFNALKLHILNSITPKFLLRKVVNSQSILSVITISEKNKENLTKYGCNKNKIIQIPNGIEQYDLLFPENIDDVISNYKLNKDDFIITYFSPPITIRGADSVIYAASHLKKKISNFKLILLSRNDGRFDKEDEYLRNLIRNYDLEENVRIISKVLDRDDVKRFILISNAVTIPFKIVQSDVPLIILEVLALGKPLISTNVDGIPELLNDNRGIIVEPSNPEQLAEKFFYIYSNPQSAVEMSQNARRYMESYPKWDDISELVMDVIIDAWNQRFIGEELA